MVASQCHVYLQNFQGLLQVLPNNFDEVSFWVATQILLTSQAHLGDVVNTKTVTKFFAWKNFLI
jgi:hypothetical protein